VKLVPVKLVPVKLVPVKLVPVKLVPVKTGNGERGTGKFDLLAHSVNSLIKKRVSSSQKPVFQLTRKLA
jgi:hypothetical protein